MLIEGVNKMKYTWKLSSDIDSFYKRLENKTYNARFSERFTHWSEDCFFLKRKGEGSFVIEYHKAYVSNSFKRYLHGIVTTTPDGISIYANLRLNLFVKVFCLFWCVAIALFSIVILLTNPIFLIVPLLMLTFSIVLINIFSGSPDEIIHLMNNVCKCKRS